MNLVSKSWFYFVQNQFYIVLATLLMWSITRAWLMSNMLSIIYQRCYFVCCFCHWFFTHTLLMTNVLPKHLQVEIGFLIPLRNIQDEGVSISRIPVFEGVNVVGRNDLSMTDKRVSRKHISLIARIDGFVEMVVVCIPHFLFHSLMCSFGKDGFECQLLWCYIILTLREAPPSVLAFSLGFD